jgi:hypothetical protein
MPIADLSLSIVSCWMIRSAPICITFSYVLCSDRRSEPGHQPLRSSDTSVLLHNPNLKPYSGPPLTLRALVRVPVPRGRVLRSLRSQARAALNESKLAKGKMAEDRNARTLWTYHSPADNINMTRLWNKKYNAYFDEFLCLLLHTYILNFLFRLQKIKIYKHLPPNKFPENSQRILTLSCNLNVDKNK